MAWWTSVPALTPLVAHDALRVSATHFLDGVGNNHMGLGGCTLAETYPYAASYAGAANPMPYTSPVNVPAQGVVCVFYKASSNLVAFYENDGAAAQNFALDIEPNGTLYTYSSPNTALHTGGLPFGVYRFLALLKGASTQQAYIDGALIGSVGANNSVPATLWGMGYGLSGNSYAFDSNDRFLAAGIFSGSATLADVQALEAALRVAVAAPMPGARIVLRAPARAGARALGALSANVVDVGRARVQLSAGFMGFGSIEGVVTVNNVPASKQVRLYDKASGALVAQTQSAASGGYAFTGIDAAREYFVVSHDNACQYNAVVSDMIKL